ncbi:hypothetical protein U1737_04765 [Sphingomonas sp. LB3N6]|uniref:hypothetical protein n=1 Tax=Sphingomonas fucosidasi TaxID=3096164 RepID=UPI002FC73BC1
MNFDDVAAQMLEFTARLDARDAAWAAYVNGTADGGPNGDGRYPLPIGADSAALVTAPQRLAIDAARLNFERIALTSGTTIVLGPEHNGKVLLVAGTAAGSNISVQVPGSVEPGWGVVLIQEGTGGPRVTVTIGNNSSGEAGFLRSRGSVFRLADQYAQAAVTCVARSSAFRSTMVLAGDIVQ